MYVAAWNSVMKPLTRRTADASGGGMGGMMQDLAFAIPGVDEAMGFAEVMKWVAWQGQS